MQGLGISLTQCDRASRDGPSVLLSAATRGEQCRPGVSRAAAFLPGHRGQKLVRQLLAPGPDQRRRPGQHRRHLGRSSPRQRAHARRHPETRHLLGHDRHTAARTQPPVRHGGYEHVPWASPSGQLLIVTGTQPGPPSAPSSSGTAPVPQPEPLHPRSPGPPAPSRPPGCTKPSAQPHRTGVDLAPPGHPVAIPLTDRECPSR